ncbi:MAG: C10 family peptidase [Pontiellaceae bacterium]|nr:C10 family peptidase [Pontiellaceae bacterium]
MVSSFCYGTPLSVDDAVARATVWMGSNPIMSAATNRVVASADMFPEADGYQVYLVHLEPSGYLVLNSDDRFPLVVSCSVDSTIDLSGGDQNAFRAMLLQLVEQAETALLQPESDAPEPTLPNMRTPREKVIYGPLLDTVWSQLDPYNRLCPILPSGYERAPTGCGQTAVAQLMRYYSWPCRGRGSHTYTDLDGSFTGTYSADFSDPYEWGNMRTTYSIANGATVAEKNAVAELMYELGVAVEADYEIDTTTSSLVDAIKILREHFYYEVDADYYLYSGESFVQRMIDDLRVGRPVLGAIPGHAVVVDGLSIIGGVITYHVNYGWGGVNNGWWAADAIPGGTLSFGITSLRPRLIAAARSNQLEAVVGEPVELEWVLPKSRTSEIDRFEILKLVPKNGDWTSDGSTIIGDNLGWSVVAADATGGDCWFADGGRDISILELGEIFVPVFWSNLKFMYYADLTETSRFTVEVSTDGGKSYKELAPRKAISNLGWHSAAYFFEGYEGQQIKLRLCLANKTKSYTEWAGIRIDDLVFCTDPSRTWYGWEPFLTDTALNVRAAEEITDAALDGAAVYYTTVTSREPGDHTLGVTVVDKNGLSSGFFGEPVVLTVRSDDEDGDGMPVAWEELYGLDVTVDDGAADLDSDGYSNYSEYLCGTDPTDAESRWKLVNEADGMPTFFGMSDRLYTIQYSTNLLERAWLPLAIDIPGSNAVISVRDYDTTGQNVRYYRVQVRVPD